MITIRYYGAAAEADVCLAFLRWQGHPCTLRVDPAVLGETAGKPGVITEMNTSLVKPLGMHIVPVRNPVGFVELYEYYQQHGCMRV